MLLLEVAKDKVVIWLVGVAGVAGLLSYRVLVLEAEEAIEGRLFVRELAVGATARVTIFIPRLVLVLAGMKSVF